MARTKRLLSSVSPVREEDRGTPRTIPPDPVIREPKARPRLAAGYLVVGFVMILVGLDGCDHGDRLRAADDDCARAWDELVAVVGPLELPDDPTVTRVPLAAALRDAGSRLPDGGLGDEAARTSTDRAVRRYNAAVLLYDQTLMGFRESVTSRKTGKPYVPRVYVVPLRPLPSRAPLEPPQESLLR